MSEDLQSHKGISNLRKALDACTLYQICFHNVQCRAKVERSIVPRELSYCQVLLGVGALIVVGDPGYCTAIDTHHYEIILS